MKFDTLAHMQKTKGSCPVLFIEHETDTETGQTPESILLQKVHS